MTNKFTPFQQTVLEQPAPVAEQKITKPSELLIAAKAVIADPRKFTRGVLARDVDGFCVPPNNPKAVCFCSVGALSHVTPLNHGADELNNDAFNYLYRVACANQYFGVADYSDQHSHTEVMAMWDAAIALAVADEDFAKQWWKITHTITPD